MLENLTQTEQAILNVIKTVIDPEVEINIVDLGLIYKISHNEADKKIEVVMTLSARGCPVGDVIIQHVETVILDRWTDYSVDVELTWEPEWTPDMITDQGKNFLNM